MSFNGSVSRSLFSPTDDLVIKCRTPSFISHKDYAKLDKEAKIEEKKIVSLIASYEIFSDEINDKEVSNRLLFLSLSKNKTLFIY